MELKAIYLAQMAMPAEYMVLIAIMYYCAAQKVHTFVGTFASEGKVGELAMALAYAGLIAVHCTLLFKYAPIIPEFILEKAGKESIIPNAKYFLNLLPLVCAIDVLDSLVAYISPDKKLATA